MAGVNNQYPRSTTEASSVDFADMNSGFTSTPSVATPGEHNCDICPAEQQGGELFGQSMSSANVLPSSNTISSFGADAAKKAESASAFIVTPPSRMFSSPPPAKEVCEPSGKACCSPPPPPCCVAKTASVSEPDSVVEMEINSGHSILNSKPINFSDMKFSRKFPSNDVDYPCRNVRPRTDSGSGLSLAPPSYPHINSPFSSDDISGSDDEDMPLIPPSIKLPMRFTSARRPPIAPRFSRPAAPRRPVASRQLPEHSFIPIQAHEDEDK